MDKLMSAASMCENTENVIKYYAGLLNEYDSNTPFYKVTNRCILLQKDALQKEFYRVTEFVNQVLKDEKYPAGFAEAIGWTPVYASEEDLNTRFSARGVSGFTSIAEHDFGYISRKLKFECIPETCTTKFTSTLTPTHLSGSLWGVLCTLSPELWSKVLVVEDDERIDWTERLMNKEYPKSAKLEVHKTYVQPIINIEDTTQEISSEEYSNQIDSLKHMVLEAIRSLDYFISYGSLTDVLRIEHICDSTNTLEFRYKWYAYTVLRFWVELYENKDLVDNLDYLIMQSKEEGIYYILFRDAIKEFMYSDIFENVHEDKISDLKRMLHEIYLSDKDVFDMESIAIDVRNLQDKGVCIYTEMRTTYS